MHATFPYPVNTWVLWQQSVPGANRPFVGYVVAVLDPGTLETLVEDTAEALGAAFDTYNGEVLDTTARIVDGEPRPIIAVPDILEGTPILVCPDPRRVSALRAADTGGVNLEAIQEGKAISIVSKNGRAPEIRVAGERIGLARRCSVDISPDSPVVVKLEAYNPDLILDGRIVSVEPFDPTEG